MMSAGVMSADSILVASVKHGIIDTDDEDRQLVVVDAQLLLLCFAAALLLLLLVLLLLLLLFSRSPAPEAACLPSPAAHATACPCCTAAPTKHSSSRTTHNTQCQEDGKTAVAIEGALQLFTAGRVGSLKHVPPALCLHHPVAARLVMQFEKR
jgi:hypothetical protein